MELFDIVDQAGNPTGETIERKRAHEIGARHRTAHIWILRKTTSRLSEKRATSRSLGTNQVNRLSEARTASCSCDGDQENPFLEARTVNNERWEILLQKRSATKDSFPNRWDTSSAGHIQAGDETKESAIRELGEELGIHATEEQLKFCGTFDIEYTKEFYGKAFHDNEIAFVYTYEEPVNLDDLVLQEEEVSEVGWFDLEDTIVECEKHNKTFCIPIDSLYLLREMLRQRENNETEK